MHCVTLLWSREVSHRLGRQGTWGREMLSEGGWGRQAGKEKPEHLVCQQEPQLPFRQCEVEPTLCTPAFSHQKELGESPTVTKKISELNLKKNLIFKRAKSALLSKVVHLTLWQVVAQPEHQARSSDLVGRGGDTTSQHITGCAQCGTRTAPACDCHCPCVDSRKSMNPPLRQGRGSCRMIPHLAVPAGTANRNPHTPQARTLGSLQHWTLHSPTGVHKAPPPQI